MLYSDFRFLGFVPDAIRLRGCACFSACFPLRKTSNFPVPYQTSGLDVNALFRDDSPMDDATLGRWLRWLRQSKGLTQSELARETSRLAGHSVSDSAISEWELHGTLPGRSHLPALAEALGVSVDMLLKPRLADFERHAKRFRPQDNPEA